MKNDQDSELKDVLCCLDAWNGRAFSSDPPVNKDGVERAAALARYFEDQERGLDKIYAAPYLRSLQIAQHLGWSTRRKILVEPGLSNVPHTRVPLPGMLDCYMSFPSIDLRHSPSSHEPPPDETPVESLPRILDIGLDIADRMHAGQNVAVVTHASSGEDARAHKTGESLPSQLEE